MRENADLLDYLTKRYTQLKQTLTRLLGNDELASDALHDAWVRLNAKEDYGVVDNPGAYVTRMSVNIAVNAYNKDSRLLTGEAAHAVLETLRDPAPGPEQIAQARSEWEVVAKALEQAPKRRRHAARLVYLEGLDMREAAKRLKVSERTVRYELKYFRDEVDRMLDEK
jgi:RNA polymerase sigma factor (sigma-70 family)